MTLEREVMLQNQINMSYLRFLRETLKALQTLSLKMSEHVDELEQQIKALNGNVIE